VSGRVSGTELLPIPVRWPLRTLRYGALACALLLAGFVAGFVAGRGRSGAPELPDLGPAPQYTLTNQLGQTASSKSFLGKVQLVTFIYPYCTTYCPLITAHLIGFEHFLTLAQESAQNRVEIVAFNLAPSVAKPQEMRAYLHQYGWRPADPRWDFLTGSEAQIRRVVTGGYHVFYQRTAATGIDGGVVTESGQAPQLAVANPLAEKVKPSFDISHNDAIVIVDRKGRIRKIYDDADVVPNGELWNDIRPLLNGD
jgi:cytochrome oxidase Cu insertion factor (SCO1/SenC/PrrC family)